MQTAKKQVQGPGTQDEPAGDPFGPRIEAGHGLRGGRSLAGLPQDALLTQAEVARRWRISARSLERWRSAGIGPRFVKLGAAVRYRAGDVARFELANLRLLDAVAAGDAGASK